MRPDDTNGALHAALTPESRSEEYFLALQGGLVQLQRCVSCAAVQTPPLPFCRTCGASRVRIEVAAGTGHIISATRVYRRFHEVSPEPPYNVVLVELDEGPRLLGLIDPELDFSSGDRVCIVDGFDTFGPWFKLVGGGTREHTVE